MGAAIVDGDVMAMAERNVTMIGNNVPSSTGTSERVWKRESSLRPVRTLDSSRRTTSTWLPSRPPTRSTRTKSSKQHEQDSRLTLQQQNFPHKWGNLDSPSLQTLKNQISNEKTVEKRRVRARRGSCPSGFTRSSLSLMPPLSGLNVFLRSA